LRREEIAVLAGLSPTWYTYLEQGRDIRPSPEVLESLARVLQLNEDERRYLYLLANGQPPPVSPAPVEGTSPAIARQTIDLIGQIDQPVYAANLYGDVVAWNPMAAEVYTDFERLPQPRRNMLWWMLTAPEARQRIVNWAEDTRDVIARFRIAAAARPWDERFTSLVNAMRAASPEFCSWWSDHQVSDQHPRVRQLRLATGEVRAVRLVLLRLTDAFHSIVLHLPVRDGDSAVVGPTDPTLRACGAGLAG
jgi:transcriptional regulator with XRE-family HTH domain